MVKELILWFTNELIIEDIIWKTNKLEGQIVDI